MLHVHRAERADGLVEALSGLLAAPPRDPFARELVSVPTRGMERWLAQRMSHRLGTSAGFGDGVCANVDFPSPRRLVGDAVAVASGIEAEEDPWLPERAVWALLDLLDSCLHEPWLHALAGHLGRVGRDDDPRRNRRFAVVRHLADLFDRYALHRPEMVRAWAAGRDDDGTGLALREDQRWQAELFRRLRARIDVPDPAERVEAACRRIAREPGLLDLPERLSVFGLTRLPAGHLNVLEALAAGREVHLFLLHPSPALWDKLDLVPGPIVHRGDDPTATIPNNRLLASWGRDAREMQLVLKTAEHADHRHPTTLVTETLLGRLQGDVRADRQPPGPPLPEQPDERPALAAGDRTVEIHSCHGRARQVEVLRDAILHALEDDPTLEPRDVIVMCPDIETFAPLIQATFGGGEIAGEDGEAERRQEERIDLRVRLADRSIRQTNPVLGVIARLLELASQRVTASQVLDVVDREPVRRRFGFDDEDVSRLEEWVTSSGIRWGLDADHRAPFKLANLEAGTWRAGLDRVLLGVALTEEGSRLYEGVLPLDDVESGAIELAGRMAELVERLQDALDDLSREQTIDRWADALAAAADALTATTERDAWQRAELDRILDDVAGEAAEAGTELTLQEVRALLAERLRGRPTRANFRTGHLTVCTLMPMRSVPHRVVCLLGMDDGVFPRRSPRDGDDLMLDDPHVGDRDPRTEDRQLLLDALLAARDRLIVTYAGNDERTNVARPPAVPIGELLDVIDETVRTDGGPARERVVVRHPLQPFDPRNFTPDALIGNQPWSFDRTTLHGARAMVSERHEPRPFLHEPLPPVQRAALALDDLVRFAEHPVRAFLRQRLEISLADFSRDVDDALPVELEPLDKAGVGRRLLEGVLAGTPLDACVAAEVARGTLPPGRLAQLVIDDVTPVVEQIAGIARRAFGDATAGAGGRAGPESVDVRIVLPDGRPLAGTIPGLYGTVLGTAAYARVRPTHRIRAWVRLLALSAAYADRDHTAVTVGRARYGADHNAFATVARLPRIDPELALGHLATIVDLWERGMREPLPIGCDSAAAYADAARREQSATRAARREWESAWNYPKEDAQLEHQLAFGGVLTFDELLARPPRDDESWDVEDTSRFGRLARRLWDPLLTHEELVDR